MASVAQFASNQSCLYAVWVKTSTIKPKWIVIHALAVNAAVNVATFANAPAVVKDTTFVATAAADDVNGAACSCSTVAATFAAVTVVNGDIADGKGISFPCSKW